MRSVNESNIAQTTNEMNQYIKEVEKEVNYEDLVNRIYSEDMNEDLRSSLVETAFNSKDLLEKHAHEIENLSVHLNQPNYERTRLAIMKMHNLEELDNMSQQTKDYKGDSQGTQPKPTQQRKESIHAQQQRVNESPKKKPADSYESLDDIPDERFEPPMQAYGQGQAPEDDYDDEDFDAPPQIDDYPDYGEYIKARESPHMDMSPIQARVNSQKSGLIGQEEFAPDDSASLALNKMLQDDPKPKSVSKNKLFSRNDSPPSQMMIPDERSYKGQDSDQGKIREANKDLDDFLGLNEEVPTAFIKKSNPQEDKYTPSSMIVPQENKINHIDERDSHKPQLINQAHHNGYADQSTNALASENAKLKHELELYKKAETEKGQKSAAIRLVMLEDQLGSANDTIKRLREENDSLRGELEVNFPDLRC